MAVWETEDESTPPAAASLPTPSATPYRTPSRSSRKSRRSVTPPLQTSSSPPPVPADRSDKGSKRSSRDVSNDDTISILDPRRFTPTLHANLVSEILSLRRDQEDKIKFIESLESSLQTTREESETLQETLLATGKESRSLKRQLALLEGGTSSALGELARERDEAVETASETKKRLEAAQKKLRSGEEDSERVHDQWAKEKYLWEEERRKYERKIHVTESRLKVLLDEIAAYQDNQMNGGQDAPESEVEESARENDAASTRSMSITNSIRFSAMNGVAKPIGNSLADELNFDADYDDETDYGGRESVLSNANRHVRNTSRDSAVSRTHRRNQSAESLMRPASAARGRLGLHHSTLERLEGDIIQEDDESQLPATKVTYTDTGVQFSPPPSPKLVPAKPSTPEPPAVPQRLDRGCEVESPPRGEWEIEANQRRKRVHIARPLTIEPPSVTNPMVNGSSQTVEGPLSPPKTPKSPYQETPPTPRLTEPPATMVTASTQTDLPPPLDPSSFGIPTLSIPSISIIPPTSRPTTPREPRLPQQFKDFGCQVSILTSVQTESVATQTDEIRIDRRLDRLPAHLHPSAVTSRPTSPAAPQEQPADEQPKQFTPVPGNVPPRNPRRLAAKSSFPEIPSSPPIPSPILEETHDAYPGNNDDGPLSGQRAPMRRPHRISSLFAGFDGGSSDEVDEFGDAELSDSEYRTALSAPRPKAGAVRQGRRSSGGVATSPEQLVQARVVNARSSMRPLGGTEVYSSFALPETAEKRDSSASVRPGSKAVSRSSLPGPSNRAGVMRKAAMIQNSIATHQRARSPSLPDQPEPPFPIPTRASSRKPPISVSAPSDGRASPTRGSEGWPRRGSSRSHYRANSIRKVRSAAVLPRNPKSRRHGSRSPPPFFPAESPGSQDLPPLPNNDITTPRNRDVHGKYRKHQSQPSTNTVNTGDTGLGSAGSGHQATSVVDSIAQTMIGEWMFKYVRRRKSFGVADAKGGDDNSNDRHKRWVWLAPYERAILWSSKQPSSGSALMGKSGRKLTIQSVLDVKDDNPAPKGAGQVFNRSILILTPQRALKFTAVSAERHYVWLTSLSFLAHSQQAIPEIVAPLPPPKPIPEQFALPPAKIRKPGIRDSIRLAKGRTTRSGPVSIASSQNDSVPPSIPTYRPTVPEPFPSLPSHQRESSRDIAEPPHIPRFHDRAGQVTLHGRKRSNTGGHVPPPLSFRGFSGPVGNGPHHAATNSTAGNSVGTAGSSDIYNNSQASSGNSNVTWAVSTAGSVRTSEASSRPSGATMNNFFDAIGTVRMEAFISPLAFSPFEESIYEQDEMRSLARRRSKELRRRASRSRQRDSYHSRGTRGTDDTEDWYAKDDPFRGF